jgi:hypothetical protein
VKEMAILDAALESARTGRTVEIARIAVAIAMDSH